MICLGFYVDWMTLIMSCVCSVSYTVSLNGLQGTRLEPSQGIRQGDPLSPYLFFIYAQGFSTLLDEAKDLGRMSRIHIGCSRL